MNKEDLKKQNHEEHENHVLHLIVNETSYKWEHQYITGAQVRQLGNIPQSDKLFLAIKRPWEDEQILDDTKVDLARPGIEKFFSQKADEKKTVSIFIDDKEYKIPRGKYSVAEIKVVGNITGSKELDEVIDGQLTSLKNDSVILIKGGEIFFSHVPDGVSS